MDYEYDGSEDYPYRETLYIPRAWSPQRIFGILLFLFATSSHVLLLTLARKRRERLVALDHQQEARQVPPDVVQFEDRLCPSSTTPFRTERTEDSTMYESQPSFPNSRPRTGEPHVDLSSTDHNPSSDDLPEERSAQNSSFEPTIHDARNESDSELGVSSLSDVSRGTRSGYQLQQDSFEVSSDGNDVEDENASNTPEEHQRAKSKAGLIAKRVFSFLRIQPTSTSNAAGVDDTSNAVNSEGNRSDVDVEGTPAGYGYMEEVSV